MKLGIVEIPILCKYVVGISKPDYKFWTKMRVMSQYGYALKLVNIYVCIVASWGTWSPWTLTYIHMLSMLSGGWNIFLIFLHDFLYPVTELNGLFIYVRFI